MEDIEKRQRQRKKQAVSRKPVGKSVFIKSQNADKDIKEQFQRRLDFFRKTENDKLDVLKKLKEYKTQKPIDAKISQFIQSSNNDENLFGTLLSIAPVEMSKRKAFYERVIMSYENKFSENEIETTVIIELLRVIGKEMYNKKIAQIYGKTYDEMLKEKIDELEETKKKVYGDIAKTYETQRVVRMVQRNLSLNEIRENDKGFVGYFRRYARNIEKDQEDLENMTKDFVKFQKTDELFGKLLQILLDVSKESRLTYLKNLITRIEKAKPVDGNSTILFLHMIQSTPELLEKYNQTLASVYGSVEELYEKRLKHFVNEHKLNLDREEQKRAEKIEEEMRLLEEKRIKNRSVSRAEVKINYKKLRSYVKELLMVHVGILNANELDKLVFNRNQSLPLAYLQDIGKIYIYMDNEYLGLISKTFAARVRNGSYDMGQLQTLSVEQILSNIFENPEITSENTTRIFQIHHTYLKLFVDNVLRRYQQRIITYADIKKMQNQEVYNYMNRLELSLKDCKNRLEVVGKGVNQSIHFKEYYRMDPENPQKYRVYKKENVLRIIRKAEKKGDPFPEEFVSLINSMPDGSDLTQEYLEFVNAEIVEENKNLEQSDEYKQLQQIIQQNKEIERRNRDIERKNDDIRKRNSELEEEDLFGDAELQPLLPLEPLIPITEDLREYEKEPVIPFREFVFDYSTIIMLYIQGYDKNPITGQSFSINVTDQVFPKGISYGQVNAVTYENSVFEYGFIKSYIQKRKEFPAITNFLTNKPFSSRFIEDVLSGTVKVEKVIFYKEDNTLTLSKLSEIKSKLKDHPYSQDFINYVLYTIIDDESDITYYKDTETNEVYCFQTSKIVDLIVKQKITVNPYTNRKFDMKFIYSILRLKKAPHSRFNVSNNAYSRVVYPSKSKLPDVSVQDIFAHFNQIETLAFTHFSKEKAQQYHNDYIGNPNSLLEPFLNKPGHLLEQINNILNPPQFPPSPVYGQYMPQSPQYMPYVPSPVYAPASPQYIPQSPVYAPASPQYMPQSPVYAPASPQYMPQSPPYMPPSPQYVPQSPAYAPASPAYVPEDIRVIPSIQCDVCKKEFRENDMLHTYKLSCDHYYHKDCVYSAQCKLCRRGINGLSRFTLMEAAARPKPQPRSPSPDLPPPSPDIMPPSSPSDLPPPSPDIMPPSSPSDLPPPSPQSDAPRTPEGTPPPPSDPPLPDFVVKMKPNQDYYVRLSKAVYGDIPYYSPNDFSHRGNIIGETYYHYFYIAKTPMVKHNGKSYKKIYLHKGESFGEWDEVLVDSLDFSLKMI